MPASKTQWSPVGKGLHWLIAILVLFAWGSVELREFWEKGDPIREGWKVLHFSIGFLVLLLTAVRLYWRSTHPRPEMIGKPWERALGHITHASLYVLLLGMPILGLAMKQFGGASTNIFWLFEIPSFVEKNTELAKQVGYLHRDLVWNIMWVLIGLHIAASLWHHFVEKDATLTRMLPSKDKS
ncbi:cytochrome b561 homolog 1 [Microbulbifer aestuariivivens]|uniref:Cytochrome b561 homolog 1 n=1 Tax=Microbulbifer aestuariivivens TaxID=1908308 RepID=A0ABP9WRH2_9GAMM